MATALPGRRQITYGKKASRVPQLGFSKNFETLTAQSPEKPSRLSRIDFSPSKSARQSPQPAGKTEVFDVPTSDSDSSTSLPSPSKRSVKTYTKTPKSSSAKAASTALQAKLASVQSDDSTTPSHGSRKRKHVHDHATDGFSSSDLDNTDLQIEAQFQTEMLQARKRQHRAPQSNSHPQLSVPAVHSAGDKIHREGPRRKRSPSKNVKDDTSAMKINGSLDMEPMVMIGTPPSTPPRPASSPNTPRSKSKVVSTPKQTELWQDLLIAQEPTPTQQMDKLFLTARAEKRTFKNRGLPAPPRRRLIDALKPSLLSSDPVDPSEDEDSIMNHESPGAAQASDADHVAASQQAGSNVAGPKFTYGQQRSYLQDTEQDLEDLLQQPLDFGLGEPSRNGAQKAQSPEDDTGGAMRNIHELRASGDNRRFIDEINTLIDDIGRREKSAVSARRSALIELSKNLCNSEFRKRFADNALEYSVLSKCADVSDDIAGSAICAVIALNLTEVHGGKSAQQILEAGALVCLSHMLEVNKDIKAIAKDRKTNMSKAAQADVTEFEETMRASDCWGKLSPVTVNPQMLALRASELLVGRLRQTGNMERLLDQQLLTTLLKILSNCVARLEDTSKKVTNDTFFMLEMVYSTLESGSVAPACATDSSLWTDERLKAFVLASEKVLSLKLLAHERLQPLIFRTCMNLANNNEEVSEAFARPGFLSATLASVDHHLRHLAEIAADEAKQASFDELLLALGALLNLAEVSDAARKIVALDSGTSLDSVLMAFIEHRGKAADADSLAESQANVVFGYLAVFLGNVCQNSEGRRRIRAKMPKQSLTTLGEAIEEFIRHHEEVDRRGEGGETWASFTQRLQATAQTLRALETI